MPPNDDHGPDLGAVGARVLVVGTASHAAGSPLGDVPAVPATVRDLVAAFVTDCRVDAAAVASRIDPATPIDLGEALTEAVEDANDRAVETLLFYFVGHGLVGVDNELYLATAATTDIDRGLRYRALPFSAVRDALSSCRASKIIVILDCCFAGRARGGIGRAVDDAFASLRGQDTYLMAAVAADELAYAPTGESYTAFSGELIRVLREGDPSGPPRLALDDIHRTLERQLAKRGLPRPVRLAGGTSDSIVVAVNKAYQPPADDEVADTVHGQCPYRGLESYGAQDASYFFGRQRLIDELVAELSARLADPGPLPVVGVSGSGKTSLLLAGLIPALGRVGLGVPGSRQWPFAPFAPGARPLETLARQVPGIDADTVRADPMAFADAIRTEFGGETSGRLILIVDQFEELFTLCDDEEERAAFVRALCACCTGPDAPALVVLGLRADFYGRVVAYPDLLAAVRRAQVVVGGMNDEELRAAIERPAAEAGLALEAGLADQLRQDLRLGRDQGNVLPLLSYALQGTWQRRRGRLLTLAGYREAGGIWDSVRNTAEQVYETLDAAEQQAATTLLLSMVRVGDGNDDTCRRVVLDDLIAERSAGEVAAIRQACDAFAGPRARLITLDRAENGAETVEIAHEALLRVWPRLRTWIDDGRTELLVAQQLADMARAWVDARRDPDYLIGGGRLAAVRDWLPRLPAVQREFVATGIRRDRRRVRRVQQVIVTLVVLLLVAAGAGGYASYQRNQAVQQRDRALALALTSEAQNLVLARPDEAIPLALEASRLQDSPAIHGLLMQYLPYSGRFLGHTGAVNTVAYSPDGRILATGSDDHTIRLWDAIHGGLIGSLVDTGGQASSKAIYSVVFSPDGRTLASAGYDGQIRLWDVARRTLITTFDNEAAYVAFSPDGRMLASADSDYAVHLWNVTDPTQVTPSGTLTGNTSYIYGVAFGPDGKSVASAGGDGTVRLWNLATGAGTVLPGTTGQMRTLAFGPNGSHTLAAIDLAHGALYMWDTNTGTETFTYSYSNLDITALAFSADGRYLGLGMANGDVVLWNAARRTQLGADLAQRNVINAVAFSPDSLTLASASADHSVALSTSNGSDLSDEPQGLSNSFRPLDTAVDSAIYTSDGRTVLTGNADSSLRLWDVAHGTLTATLPGATGPQHALRISPDGRTLATAGGGDFHVHLWNLVTRKPMPLDGQNGEAQSIAFDSTTGALRAVDVNGVVSTWDTAHDVLANTFTPVPNSTTAVYASISSDGHFLALSTDLGSISLWDLTTQLQIGAISGVTIAMGGRMVFSPDDGMLAVPNADNSIGLWAVPTGHLTATLVGHEGFVNDVAFSPDGGLVASAGQDHTLRLWDAKSGAETAEISFSSQASTALYSVTFSPSGHAVAVTGDLGVFLFDPDETRNRDQICALPGVELTPDEWARLVPNLPYQHVCG